MSARLRYQIPLPGHPTHPLPTRPPPLPLGMLQAGTEAQTTWIMYLVGLEACHPPRPADPSERQQTPFPRNSLFSYPLPDEWKVPAALPCPAAGSPPPLSPSLTCYPPWCSHNPGFLCRLWPRCAGAFHPCRLPLPGWGSRAEPLPSPPPPCSELTTHCQSGYTCVVFAAGGCCLSGNITIL